MHHESNNPQSCITGCMQALPLAALRVLMSSPPCQQGQRVMQVMTEAHLTLTARPHTTPPAMLTLRQPLPQRVTQAKAAQLSRLELHRGPEASHLETCETSQVQSFILQLNWCSCTEEHGLHSILAAEQVGAMQRARGQPPKYPVKCCLHSLTQLSML